MVNAGKEQRFGFIKNYGYYRMSPESLKSLPTGPVTIDLLYGNYNLRKLDNGEFVIAAVYSSETAYCLLED